MTNNKYLQSIHEETLKYFEAVAHEKAKLEKIEKGFSSGFYGQTAVDDARQEFDEMKKNLQNSAHDKFSLCKDWFNRVVDNYYTPKSELLNLKDLELIRHINLTKDEYLQLVDKYKHNISMLRAINDNERLSKYGMPITLNGEKQKDDFAFILSTYYRPAIFGEDNNYYTQLISSGDVFNFPRFQNMDISHMPTPEGVF